MFRIAFLWGSQRPQVRRFSRISRRAKAHGRSSDPFQCAGGGSCPLTRSNIFKHLHHLNFVILTSGLPAF